ncbi:hypothetical protein D3C78_1972140 [compost metagenome]
MAYLRQSSGSLLCAQRQQLAQDAIAALLCLCQGQVPDRYARLQIGLLPGLQ